MSEFKQWWCALDEDWLSILWANLELPKKLGEKKFLKLAADASPLRLVDKYLEEPRPDNHNNEFLTELLSLKSLSCVRCGLTNLKALTNFRHLEKLDLSYNLGLKNLGPLAKLGNLRELSLYGTKTTRLEALKGLKRLKKLHTFIEYLVDITPLSELSRLEELAIGGGRVSDLSPLKKLVNLRKLDLDALQKVTDIGALNSMPLLCDLNMRWMKGVTELSDLSSLSVYPRGLPQALSPKRC